MGPHSMVTRGTDLSSLAGRELSAVCFVRNYVEFHFDGPILRFLAPPHVRRHDGMVQFPEEGSCDVLCALIGQMVEQAEDQPDRLALMFPNDVRVEMLKSSPDTGPEVAHFVPIADGAPDVASMLIWENLIPTPGDADGA